MGFRYHPISQAVAEERYDDAATAIVAAIGKVARAKMVAEGIGMEQAVCSAQCAAADDVDVDRRTMRRWISRLRATGRDVIVMAIEDLKLDPRPIAKKPSKKAAKRAA